MVTLHSKHTRALTFENLCQALLLRVPFAVEGCVGGGEAGGGGGGGVVARGGALLWVVNTHLSHKALSGEHRHRF
jgi:hypothetical protein